MERTGLNYGLAISKLCALIKSCAVFIWEIAQVCKFFSVSERSRNGLILHKFLHTDGTTSGSHEQWVDPVGSRFGILVRRPNAISNALTTRSIAAVNDAPVSIIPKPHPMKYRRIDETVVSLKDFADDSCFHIILVPSTVLPFCASS